MWSVFMTKHKMKYQIRISLMLSFSNDRGSSTLLIVTVSICYNTHWVCLFFLSRLNFFENEKWSKIWKMTESQTRRRYEVRHFLINQKKKKRTMSCYTTSQNVPVFVCKSFLMEKKKVFTIFCCCRFPLKKVKFTLVAL